MVVSPRVLNGRFSSYLLDEIKLQWDVYSFVNTVSRADARERFEFGFGRQTRAGAWTWLLLELFGLNELYEWCTHDQRLSPEVFGDFKRFPFPAMSTLYTVRANKRHSKSGNV